MVDEINRQSAKQFIDSNYSPTFCIKPFTEICNTARGGMKVCCQSHTNILKHEDLTDTTYVNELFHNDKFKQIRTAMQKGERVDACRNCYEWEDSGGHSMRIEYSDRLLKQDKKIVDQIFKTGTPIVKSLDLKMGNKCNLACVMCDPSSSSLIGKERQQYPPSQELDMEVGRSKQIQVDFSQDEFEEIKNVAGNIINVKSTGGEPMLLPGFKDLLEYLVENGFSKNIKFTTVTNGTVDFSSYLHLMNQFKHFSIQWSIDGIGDTYNFVRYPGNWNSVSRKHQRVMKSLRDNNYENVKLGASIAISVYNIHQMPDILSYVHEDLKINGVADYNIVREPDFMSPALAPKSIIDKSLKVFKEKTNKLLNQGIDLGDKDNIDELIMSKVTELDSNLEKKNKLIRRLHLVNTYWKDVRNKDAYDYIPFLKDIRNENTA